MLFQRLLPMRIILLMIVLMMACVVEHRATTVCYQASPRAECSELNLSKVPTNLNSFINSLDLSKNPIRQLRPTDFGPYTELETLLLSDCELKHLPEDVFSKLRKMRLIDLARNKLTSIPTKMFEHNKNLRKVVLDENGSLHSPILKSASVEILSISACGIEYIYDETFSRVPNLKDLDLTRNPLQTVSPNAFRNNVLKNLWIDSVNSLKQVAHKLCGDKVSVVIEVQSMHDQLCIRQTTKDSNNLDTSVNIQTETTHLFTVVTTILAVSSDKYTDNEFNHFHAVSSTSSSHSITPSSPTMFHENNSTVDAKRTTDSLSKDTKLPPADDEGIRLRIGKTEVWVISGLIIIGLVILLTYRYMHAIRKGRENTLQPDQTYEYVPPLYRRQLMRNGYVTEIVYGSVPQNNGYEIPYIRPPPLPPRPPTLGV